MTVKYFVLLSTLTFALVFANFEELRKSSIRDVVSQQTLKLIIPNDYNDFLTLLKPILIKRVSDTDGNRRVRKYIINKMESYGWNVKTHEFQDNTPYGFKKFANIIADLPKDSQNFKQEQANTRHRVVFACHYDSKLFTSINFIGAIDSAVPCAMLLDMAKYFHENADKSIYNNIVRNIQFIFFDGEEAFVDWTPTDSIYGSRGYARDLLANYGLKAFDSIDLFVLLDLLGAKTSSFPNYFPAASGGAYSKLYKIESHLVSRGLLSQRQVRFFYDVNNQRGSSMIEDDHLPFLRKKVPILHLIPSPFPSQWHQASDNLQNLDKGSIQDLRLIFKLFLMDILNADVNKMILNL